MDGSIDIIGLLFWIIFFALIFWPHFQYKNLMSARYNLIRKLEAKYKVTVITMIHRQERIAFFNIPVYRFIDIEDSEAVLRAIRNSPSTIPIMLILHTPGGLVLAASQIAQALKRHPSKKIVVIPHYAMSGGTLIALAADEIWMDPNAVIGPLDPQIVSSKGLQLPAPSLLKVVMEKGKDKVSDETLIMADVAKKAIKQMQELIIDLTKDRLGEEKAMELAKKLTEGYYTHDYPITVRHARELGLIVKDEIPKEIYELMNLYPQAQVKRPGIEYLPYPLPIAPGKSEKK